MKFNLTIVHSFWGLCQPPEVPVSNSPHCNVGRGALLQGWWWSLKKQGLPFIHAHFFRTLRVWIPLHLEHPQLCIQQSHVLAKILGTKRAIIKKYIFPLSALLIGNDAKYLSSRTRKECCKSHVSHVYSLCTHLRKETYTFTEQSDTNIIILLLNSTIRFFHLCKTYLFDWLHQALF